MKARISEVDKKLTSYQDVGDIIASDSRAHGVVYASGGKAQCQVLYNSTVAEVIFSPFARRCRQLYFDN